MNLLVKSTFNASLRHGSKPNLTSGRKGKSMALYRTKRTPEGLVKIKLKSNEVKRYIMRANNWTEEQYNKNYDIFKNKLRAYESFADKKKQSPVEVLYKEARAKVREGDEYKPSLEMQRIRKFTSVSSGQAGQKALQSERYKQARGEMYASFTDIRFKGFIDSNAKAQEINNTIKDPVKREKALADYANKIHAKIDEQKKNANGEAIPSGEAYGSDLEVDFDISEYL